MAEGDELSMLLVVGDDRIYHVLTKTIQNLIPVYQIFFIELLKVDTKVHYWPFVIHREYLLDGLDGEETEWYWI